MLCFDFVCSIKIKGYLSLPISVLLFSSSHYYFAYFLFVLFFAAEEVSVQSQRHIPVYGLIQYTLVDTEDVSEALYSVAKKNSRNGAFLKSARFRAGPRGKDTTVIQHMKEGRIEEQEGFWVRRRRL